MMPEAVVKMMLRAMLPLKLDTKITLTKADEEPSIIHLKGDIFIGKLKGQDGDRIIIALEVPEEEAEG